MGSVFTTDAERCIDIRIEGTAPIEQVELLRCTEVLCTWQIARYDPKRIRVLWGGAETRGNVTDQRQTWNGNLRIQNGRFDKVNPVALQCPNDRITTKALTLSDFPIKRGSITLPIRNWVAPSRAATATKGKMAPNWTSASNAGNMIPKSDPMVGM